MKISWKPLGRNLLFIAERKNEQQFKRGIASVEDDGGSVRHKDATNDENVKLVHTFVMCDRRRDLRSIASEVGLSFGAVQSI